MMTNSMTKEELRQKALENVRDLIFTIGVTMVVLSIAIFLIIGRTPEVIQPQLIEETYQFDLNITEDELNLKYVNIELQPSGNCADEQCSYVVDMYTATNKSTLEKTIIYVHNTNTSNRCAEGFIC